MHLATPGDERLGEDVRKITEVLKKNGIEHPKRRSKIG